MSIVHKTFYASGFLYHPISQQILLQQSNESIPQWSLFGGEGTNSSDPARVVKDIIEKHIGIKLNPNKILSVYDYFHEELGKNHYIVYAEVKESIENFKVKKGYTVGWFTFKQLYKLGLTVQTRQDITVGERVIKAVARSLEASNQNASLVNKG